MKTRPILTIGALGSLAFTLYAGRHAAPVLQGLFCAWVISPFLCLLLAARLAERWPEASRNALRMPALVLGAISIVVYAAAALVAAKPVTPVFLFLPGVSWIFAGLTVARGARMAGRSQR